MAEWDAGDHVHPIRLLTGEYRTVTDVTEGVTAHYADVAPAVVERNLARGQVIWMADS